ncbi:sulfite exporter TauE/SafE family protein [Lysinibacillus fusiformis]|uniref:sulfite exporter TauE/SafE family protein n=1 Tax=Lysinibacillus fusiformis TaxID=28031 RepID=UPI000D346775|nr:MULTISPECIES: sulfite exporter TauE/SafE family protein [Lysinibacillus]MED4669444.1 sulfite exporter TauE/SafE family protein [Lysinibacillus fusiformis]QAS56045.1 sulfite exporter TauE/SafE family protein [Lysinibacillus sphaericus]RDV34844.1 sulfite exporter TauE/SafE family protein [Lysinibacillus fusiformis]GED62807.1 membrane protein [Lysinibacillus fusiformis]
MEILLQEWLSIKGFILFTIGLLAAIIGVLFGAAGFILMPSLLLVGIPIHTTVAVNKFATGISALSNVVSFVITGRLSVKKYFSFMIVSCLGGVLGAIFAILLSERIMNVVACISLIFAFMIVLRSNKWIVKDVKEIEEQRINKLIPFAISMYDGGFGPGSALMNITYFLKKQYHYLKAVELSRMISLSSCTGAFLFYYLTGIVNWGIAIPVSLGSIAGSFIGLKIIPYIQTKWIQIILPIIFLFLLVQVVTDLIK